MRGHSLDYYAAQKEKARAEAARRPAAPAALDAFQNMLARLGFGTSNLLEGTQYPLTRLTRNYALMTSLYRSHWIVRRVIDTIPEDMCKNWFDIDSQVAPEAIDRYRRVERRTRTKAAILRALKWGRLYGGAAAVMMIAGHEDRLDRPLNLDEVMPGAYRGLLVLDRWSGITPSAEQIEDVDDPEFGLPAWYTVTLETGGTFRVHASRVLRFTGRELPAWELQAEQHWGVSEIEVIYDELKKRQNTSWNISSLVFLANIRIFKMSDIAEMLATNNQVAQQRLYRILSAQNHLMSNMGVQVLSKDDDFDTKQYSFSGLNDIYESFMLDLAGACEIPVTRLFGRAPAGLNATGESDLQNYYDSLGQKQESEVSPQIDKLLPVMATSVWGEVPDDLDHKWRDPRTPREQERAELGAKKMETIGKAYDLGLLSQRTAMKEMQQMGDATGLFTNINDEEIEAADPTVRQEGEMGGELSGFLGPAPDAGRAMDADFDESDHPREDDGKFKGAGGTAGEHRQEIIDLYDYALSNASNRQRKVVYGAVGKEEAARLQGQAEGMPDVSGYTRIIDNYAIRHIQAGHGDPNTESRRGQLAITKDDIAMIPDIVSSYDKAEAIETGGRDGIGYTKRINGTVYYIEELRVGRKELAAVSMRKFKARASD
jgi:phage-related protein (TIGR01555 family)